MILKQKSVPLSIRRIYNTALCNTAAISAKSGIQNRFSLICAKQFLTSITKLYTFAVWRPCNNKNVIISVYFLDMPALSGKIVQSCGKQCLFHTVFFKACHIWIEFLDFCCTTCTVYQIIPSVIIKQNGSIMIHSVYLAACPRSVFNVRSLVYIGFSSAITSKKYIEVTVMVSKTCRPLSMRIIIFTIFESLLITISVSVIDVIAYLPWNQIFWFHDWGTRTEIHCGAYHIVGIIHTNNVLVRNICPYNRVRYGCCLCSVCCCQLRWLKR